MQTIVSANLDKTEAELGLSYLLSRVLASRNVQIWAKQSPHQTAMSHTLRYNDDDNMLFLWLLFQYILLKNDQPGYSIVVMQLKSTK